MLLGVNIDHVATLRNARGGKDPEIIEAARICEKQALTGLQLIFARIGVILRMRTSLL